MNKAPGVGRFSMLPLSASGHWEAAAKTASKRPPARAGRWKINLSLCLNKWMSILAPSRPASQLPTRRRLMAS